MPSVILVIEDDPRSLRLLELILQSWGYQSRSAKTGDEGLALMRSSRFDLVLLDLMLPGMDGFELLRRVRLDPELADVPVVVVSAGAHLTNGRDVSDLGVDAYSTKPYCKDELLNVVGSLIDRGA